MSIGIKILIQIYMGVVGGKLLFEITAIVVFKRLILKFNNKLKSYPNYFKS